MLVKKIAQDNKKQNKNKQKAKKKVIKKAVKPQTIYFNDSIKRKQKNIQITLFFCKAAIFSLVFYFCLKYLLGGLFVCLCVCVFGINLIHRKKYKITWFDFNIMYSLV